MVVGNLYKFCSPVVFSRTSLARMTGAVGQREPVAGAGLVVPDPNALTASLVWDRLAVRSSWPGIAVSAAPVVQLVPPCPSASGRGGPGKLDR